MALYEYRCGKCKREFELEQRITDQPKRFCPKCDGPVTRLISRSTFVLKGGGWPGKSITSEG